MKYPIFGNCPSHVPIDLQNLYINCSFFASVRETYIYQHINSLTSINC